ncbi:hypothetical protein DBT48_00150 [Aerococcus mictus]|uniref:hypothetical protein n=1 Tax=Aerococcus mictus TaxID=2976810 RepID=UPI000DCE6A2A|nr:hypothetical protein [Aerococcus mictus]RAV75605.1 hypothetical protein DBT48_00150 [Aerococcus mictus]
MASLFKKKNKRNEPVKKKTKENTMSKFYKKAFIFFGLGSALLFLSPIVTGTEYKIESTPVGELSPITDKIQIKMVKAAYNPRAELFRVDFEIQTDASNPALVNLEYYAFAIILKDTDEEIPGEIVQVNPKYLVAFFKKVPDNYKAIGVTLKPSYIEEAITNDPNMEKRKVFVNFLQEDVPEDTNISITTANQYEADWIRAKVDEVQQEIEEHQEDIRLSRIKIENNKKTMEENKADTSLMTKEEVEEYERGRRTLETNILQEEGLIEKKEEAIKKLEERKENYNKQIQELENKMR